MEKVIQINKEKSKEYWNKNLDPQNVGGPDEVRDVDLEIKFHRHFDQKFAERFIGNVIGKTICDIGGGLGTNAIHFAKQGARVIVVDFSENRLEKIEELAKKMGLEGNIQCVCSCMENIPLCSESIDIVYTKAVLIHSCDLLKTLKEIRRILKKNGKFVFIEPKKSNPFVELYRELFAPKEWKDIVNYFELSQERMIRTIFSTSKTKLFFIFGFFPFIFQFKWRNLFLFKFLSYVIYPLDFLLLKIPFLKKLGWFAVIYGKKT
jgi:ubiquinone/menaquinone biosynthesis C-methylase UbiE